MLHGLQDVAEEHEDLVKDLGWDLFLVVHKGLPIAGQLLGVDLPILSGTREILQVEDVLG